MLYTFGVVNADDAQHVRENGMDPKDYFYDEIDIVAESYDDARVQATKVGDDMYGVGHILFDLPPGNGTPLIFF